MSDQSRPELDHRITESLHRGIAAAYLVGSYHQTDIYLRWLYSNSNRMRTMLAAVDDTGQNYPGRAILLAGVDNARQ